MYNDMYVDWRDGEKEVGGKKFIISEALLDVHVCFKIGEMERRRLEVSTKRLC